MCADVSTDCLEIEEPVEDLSDPRAVDPKAAASVPLDDSIEDDGGVPMERHSAPLGGVGRSQHGWTAQRDDINKKIQAVRAQLQQASVSPKSRQPGEDAGSNIPLLLQQKSMGSPAVKGAVMGSGSSQAHRLSGSKVPVLSHLVSGRENENPSSPSLMQVVSPTAAELSVTLESAGDGTSSDDAVRQLRSQAMQMKARAGRERNKARAAEQRMKALQEKCTTLESEVARLRTRIQHDAGTIPAKQSPEVTKAVKIKEQYRREAESLRKKLDQQNPEKVLSLMSEVKDLQLSEDQLKEQVKSLEKLLKDAERKYNDQEQTKQAERDSARLAQLSAEITSVTKENKKLKEAKDNLERTLRQRASETAVIGKQSDSHKKKAQEFKAQIKSLTDKARVANQARNAAQQDLQSLTRQLEEAKAEAQQHKRELSRMERLRDLGDASLAPDVDSLITPREGEEDNPVADLLRKKIAILKRAREADTKRFQRELKIKDRGVAEMLAQKDLAQRQTQEAEKESRKAQVEIAKLKREIVSLKAQVSQLQSQPKTALPPVPPSNSLPSPPAAVELAPISARERPPTNSSMSCLPLPPPQSFLSIPPATESTEQHESPNVIPAESFVVDDEEKIDPEAEVKLSLPPASARSNLSPAAVSREYTPSPPPADLAKLSKEPSPRAAAAVTSSRASSSHSRQSKIPTPTPALEVDVSDIDKVVTSALQNEDAALSKPVSSKVKRPPKAQNLRGGKVLVDGIESSGAGPSKPKSMMAAASRIGGGFQKV